MSRGGAERKRAGEAASEAGSSRVTAPAQRSSSTRRPNWAVLILVGLVMVGLVGGYFVALASGGGQPASTTTTTLAP